MGTRDWVDPLITNRHASELALDPTNLPGLKVKKKSAAPQRKSPSKKRPARKASGKKHPLKAPSPAVSTAPVIPSNPSNPMPKPFHQLSLDQFVELLATFPFERRIESVHMHHTWRPNHSQYRGLSTIVSMWEFH